MTAPSHVISPGIEIPIHQFPDPVIGMDDKGIIRQCNSEFEKLLRFNEREIIKKNIETLLAAGTYRPLITDLSDRTFTLFMKNSEHKKVPVKIIPIQVRNSALNFFIVKDMTKTYNYTKRLKIMNKQVKEKNYLFTSFHDAMLNIMEDMFYKNQELIKAERTIKSYFNRLEQNMEEAREFQAKLIEFQTPKVYNIRFFSRYIPCEWVGGDIINIRRSGDHIWFYIADIAGHGIPAVIISSFIKALLDDWIKEKKYTTPKDIIVNLHKVLIKETIFVDNFLTLLIGTMDTKDLTVRYMNAGHMPMLYESEEGISYSEIKKGNRPITPLFDVNDYNEQEITLHNNSRLFLFSDGMIEWSGSRESTVFGLPGLKRHFEENRLTEESIMSLIYSIKQTQKDDMSFILIDVSDSFEKNYYADLNKMPDIISDFENELKSRYSDQLLIKAGHCFYELIHNAIEHGNNDDNSKMVSVYITFLQNGLNIKICDQGQGFDWKQLNLKQPGTLADVRGRGLFLVNTFANTLTFNKIGNEVHCLITE